MIRSMTGYGAAEIERDGQRLAAEMRSVNHRFCEVSIRAPKLVSPFEDQIRQLIQDRFARGKINLTVTWSGVGETGETLRVNEPVASRGADLNEANLFRIRVQAVGFRVHGDPVGAAHDGQESSELFVRINHATNISGRGVRCHVSGGT